jgi:hypothetical protein
MHSQRTQLRDGTVTMDRRLDRCVEFDERSRNFPLGIERFAAMKTKVWQIRKTHMGDQGEEGACVEYGITHEMGAQPQVVYYKILNDIRSGHHIYWPAQQGDQWPGGSYPGAQPFYEGTSVLAGLKQTVALGYYSGYTWTFDIDSHAKGVISEGPAVVGITMVEGMMDPEPGGLMRDDGNEVGGHCMAWNGVVTNKFFGRGRPRQTVAEFVQSWGLDFGDHGRVYMELGELENRLKDNGEVAHPVRTTRGARLQQL